MTDTGRVDAERQTTPWWRDARQRTRAVVIAFAVLALGGILFPAFTNYLFAGDKRIVVVTMAQDAGQSERQQLKDTCGSLPGVRVIADRGDPDPRVQGRFPVRFDVKDITAAEYSALAACINRSPGTRGLITENDGN